MLSTEYKQLLLQYGVNIFLGHGVVTPGPAQREASMSHPCDHKFGSYSIFLDSHSAHD